MIWAVVAILVGVALGVAFVLLLARPDSIRSARKPAASTRRAPAEPVPPSSHTKRSHIKSSNAIRSARLPEPIVVPAQAAPTHDTPPLPHRPVDFSEAALRAAWRRQGGLCAQCGRLLIWANRNRDSGIGAWQSHHRIPRDQGGTSDLRNCVLFCSGAANCHFNTGHGGIGWHHYSALEDSSLLYLHYGMQKVDKTAPQTRTKPGLIQEVFGILAPRKAKTHSAKNPNAKRAARPSLPLEDDYDGAY